MIVYSDEQLYLMILHILVSEIRSPFYSFFLIHTGCVAADAAVSLA